MKQTFEDFLVELAKKRDEQVLGRLPGYLRDHYAQTGNVSLERDRLIIAFRDKAPKTTLSSKILDVIELSR